MAAPDADKTEMNPTPEQKLKLLSFRIRRRFLAALALALALSGGAALERWVLMTGHSPRCDGGFPADGAGLENY